MTDQDLAFTESLSALEIRIRAHQRYSSMQIETVLEELMAGNAGFRRICDLGCGNGNYTNLFASKADLYVGLDANAELLEQAAHKAQEQRVHNALFMQWDMNETFRFCAGSFDLLFAGFSAYYVNDAERFLRDCLRMLAPGGEMLLIGPVSGNAEELDRLGVELFGMASSKEKDVRMARLQQEFAPILERAARDTRVVVKDFSLTFPDAREYLRYYKATPQFVELARSASAPADAAIERAISSTTGLRLTKRTVFLSARKL